MYSFTNGCMDDLALYQSQLVESDCREKSIASRFPLDPVIIQYV